MNQIPNGSASTTDHPRDESALPAHRAPGAVRWEAERSPDRHMDHHMDHQMDRYQPGEEPGQLLGYYRVLTRHRRALLLCALLGGLLGFLLHLHSLPVYRARTSLDIQNLNGDFLGMHDVAPTGEAQGSSADLYIQTQIKLLQSDTLLERTVAKLRAEPHAASLPPDDLLSRWAAALHLPGGTPVPYEALLGYAAKGVKVKPLGMTRLVEVTCDSWNAQFSAHFCNTLTNEFQETDQEVRSAEAAKTSDWLTRQVSDVRLQVEAAQRKLEEATGGDGLVLSQENTSVTEDRLRQLQAELVKAQADRMEKQAAFASGQAAPANAMPSVLDSPAYQASEAKLADLRGRVAELVPPLTEENPKVIHLRAQIAQVERDLAGERAAMLSRSRSDYEAATQRERLLSLAYNAQAVTASAELDRANKVNLLRREAESAQQLYQTLLGRAKEAGFASAMQVTTIRVLDRAKAPEIPVAPRRASSVAAGAMLGLLCGFGFAFARDRATEILRAPGDSKRLLGVAELGTIPAAFGKPRLALVSSLGGKLLEARAVPAAGAPTQVAPDVSMWRESASIAAEAYRNATYSLLLATAGEPGPHVYVVASPNTGEGKTTVASNLGVALSQAKRRVVLLDGDLRKPRLSKVFGVADGPGFRDVLRGEIDLHRISVTQLCRPTEVPNLFVVPPGSGREEVTELLHSPRAGEFLALLAAAFDVVLIDTPPMLHMADARILAGYANGVILVVRAGVTHREEATGARDLFAHDRVRLLGTILNAFDPSREGKRSYYRSYYRYHGSGPEAGQPEEASA